ncbi:MAG: hypothetical protein JNG89_11700 [Planctomycetaceae bacterium]|nr:hypothetical protein [Planctomycetaceae bacterium]
MSGRSSQPSIQLFPFLAVLMCALGALILLLLVVTSRMRDQARARAVQVQSATIAVAAPVRPPLLPVELWQPASTPPAPVLHPGAPRALTPPPEPDALRRQWQRTVADLEASVSAEEAALRTHRSASDADEAALRALSAKLAEQQQIMDAMLLERTAAQQAGERGATRRAELQRVIADKTSEIEQLRVQQAEAASRYSILPFDGRTGTIRRPIYIECTESGLRFASEDITLVPDQLNGFPAVRNPLMAGADALIDYWSLKALKEPGAAEGGKPYVLLIVRPRGTVGYYVARRMLDTLGQQFGYELVPEDLVIAWPKTEPGAIAACRAAIDAALQDRGRYVAGGGNAPPGSLEPLRVTDGSGRFSLDEVEQLRGGERMVYFGGREVNRAPGGGRPPMSPPGRPNDDAAPHAESDAPGSLPQGSPAVDGPLRDRLAQAGTGLPPGQRASAGVPAAAGAAAAAQAADAFTAEAAARSPGNLQPRGAGAVTGTGRGEPDVSPRPLPSLDAIDAANRPPSRSVNQNPGAVLRDPGSQIGLERKVHIRVEQQRVVVESEPAIDIAPGTSREELQSQLAQTLRSHFQGWGRPPRSFYWMPQIKCSVLPGGHQHAQRLLDFTKEWELPSEVEYALE